ncbi:putative esterase [Parabacteroides sp. PF5-5]|uniref:carboxylesterase family protein n=1 Tax=unclassified Parabacteroides TaxID=2649774 RepID=UPI0024736065|nr:MULTISPECIES: alpha/beta hydrolase [unclassified Parabacteroides]MDH6304924.1 putative esterase [Parabacteroides sp. PH5-39]MDH6315990.1 putative esterase [Parabacteroides sp. PF5-13]MDH6319647.1 putative esterase [Parabacteroides sp. PH5-13]MDH6323378.1 putative esterase [Parabacteroides sp. PH5-8]MDH6327113.1 putative esterase [Parabacteroides sp. PH5-41]
MKKYVLTAICLILTNVYLFAGLSVADEIKKQTYIYGIKDRDTLRLDKYEIPSPAEEERTCVIFVFGGGFANGERDNEFNTAFMHELAKSGYVAIAIDYRLGMKDASKQLDGNPMTFVGMLDNAINIAVEDLYDATRFVFMNAGEWNIDKNRIVACGSSAGAITVLQGEYLWCNLHEAAKRLPDDFCYGGIIAFAGAIFSNQGGLKWTVNPSPIQLFHGNADSNVPYGKLEMMDWAVYGSQPISQQLKESELPYYFYDVENAAHEISGDPMVQNLNEIRTFITKYVENKEPLMIHTQMKQLGKPELKKELELMDFIKANY